MAALDQWLEGVWRLLAPLHPESLTLVQSTQTRAPIEWCEEALPEQDVVGAYPSQDAGAGVGWLVEVGSRDEATFGLLLCTSQVIPRGSADLKLAASIARASFRLLWPDPGKSAHEGVDASLHELRNAINCVAMSATLVAGPELPAGLRGFADDLNSGVSRSLKALRDMADHLKQ
ncbi:hypothetical protein [Arenimonas donghaensis]|uniref:Uncharacterized protein n=1 Tax=Arenimonas donghaensis DSM 18148 = HO3-R19 TaxID=1121014 RepID=A0A087MJT7_9GAMM|nr:hypothetical protein [Arenimonas donghaensis]KFL37140.1 hypothetical protein N788_11480 [Arenimonas donghaensis DSM 18148 = HO3-R19]